MIRRKRRFRRGKDRTGGYYGRYNGHTHARRENKFHDVTVAFAPVAVAGSLTAALLTIPQGVTESQRIGRKCTIKSIGMRFQMHLLLDAGSMNAHDTCRVMLLIDHQANGAAPVPLDIIEPSAGPLYRSYQNLANSSRFSVLYDRMFSLNPTYAAGNGTANEAGGMTFDLKYFKKCNVPVEYDLTTGAITEIRSNNLVLVCFSDQARVRFNASFRFRFVG